jgi:hypothetical protein
MLAIPVEAGGTAVVELLADCMRLAPIPKGNELAALGELAAAVAALGGVAVVAVVAVGAGSDVFAAWGGATLIGPEAAGGSDGGAWFNATYTP